MSSALATLIALASLALSALFSGAETGFMTVSRVRLHRRADPEAPRVRSLLANLRDIEDPVLTCLVGTPTGLPFALPMSTWARKCTTRRMSGSP